MKISARNVIKGTVLEVKAGAVNTEVVLEIAGGTRLVAVITKESAGSLGLAPGNAAYAVIKASSIMIGVD